MPAFALKPKLNCPHVVLNRTVFASGDPTMAKAQAKVILPSSLDNFFDETGYCDDESFEARRASRLRIRREASMRIEESPPSLQRIDRDWIVIVKDISRVGISFLSHDLLWPSEKIFIRFRGRQIRAKIVRCRQLGPQCWECGADMFYFKNLEEDQEVSA